MKSIRTMPATEPTQSCVVPGLKRRFLTGRCKPYPASFNKASGVAVTNQSVQVPGGKGPLPPCDPIIPPGINFTMSLER